MTFFAQTICTHSSEWCSIYLMFSWLYWVQLEIGWVSQKWHEFTGKIDEISFFTKKKKRLTSFGLNEFYSIVDFIKLDFRTRRQESGLKTPP